MELLVAIAVITLLAAILFPVFAQAREKARQATCLSNLRQIGMAALMYTHDYDDVLLWNPLPGGMPGNYWDNVSTFGPSGPIYPYRGQNCVDQPSTSFVTLLQPYLHSAAVFHCPSYPGYPPTSAFFGGYAASLNPAIYPGVGYGINPILIGSYCRPRTLSSLKNSPSEVILFADSERVWNFSITWGTTTLPTQTYWGWTEIHPSQPPWSVGFPRHHGGLDFVYADGHAHFGVPTIYDQVPGYMAAYYASAKLE
jgi:type II secretory pathway pseudopilin PulG